MRVSASMSGATSASLLVSKYQKKTQAIRSARTVAVAPQWRAADLATAEEGVPPQPVTTPEEQQQAPLPCAMQLASSLKPACCVAASRVVPSRAAVGGTKMGPRVRPLVATAAVTPKLSSGRRHTLEPARNYDPSDPKQLHYRLAESQFLRMLSGHGTMSTITKIEYFVNPVLERTFEAKKSEYDQLYGKGNHETRLAFHGTSGESIEPIMTGGFQLSKVGSKTDSGWYGAGVYFSEQ
eukprot:COSAG05_NODE_7323_length_827_cov_1.326923_1_plen_237_part_10